MLKIWKSTHRWLPGLLISVIAIVIILYFVDLHRFFEAILSANYWLLLAAFIFSYLWLAVRGIVWRTLLRDKARYRDVFLIICEGYLMNNVLPFRLGEIGRAFLLSRKSSLAFMEVLPSIIIERVLDLAISAALLLGSIPFVVGASGAEGIALVIGGLVIAGLVILYILARNQGQALKLFDRISSHFSGLQKVGRTFLLSLFSGLSILIDGKLFIRVILWMILNWVIGIFQFYLLILAFFPQATLVWSLFGLGAVAFGNAIPSLPGAVGTYEGALSAAVTLLSGDQSKAFAFALISHLINYLSTGLIGLVALSNEGETLMSVYRQLRKRQVSFQESENSNDLLQIQEDKTMKGFSNQARRQEISNQGDREDGSWDQTLGTNQD